MKLNAYLLLALSALGIFAACKKESGSTTLRIKLTDAPASYEEVNIDLREVRLKFESDTSSWVTLQTRAGIYNLLKLQNGIDTLISEVTLPQTNVKEVRLVLGDNNTIKAGGIISPLVIPSGSESGLKIKVNKQLRNSIDSITVDFDAALSVAHEHNGYKLRPVLRLAEK
jgi:hypothetical protein